MIEKIFLLVTAMHDTRTPWYAKVLVILTLAYIISPIDIIPDFIPVLGLLDEVILVPLALIIILKLIPEPVKQAHNENLDDKTRKRLQIIGGTSVIIVWLLVISITCWILKP